MRERAYSYVAEQLIADAAEALVGLVAAEMWPVVWPVVEQTYPRGYAGWCEDIDAVAGHLHILETRRRVTWKLVQAFQADYEWLCEEIDGA